jgi:hypothetical protein
MDTHDLLVAIKEGLEQVMPDATVKRQKRGLHVETEDGDEFLIPTPIDLGEDPDEDDDEEEDDDDDD